MAKNTQPVLKRCRTLGVSPAAMGYSKTSNKNPGGQRRAKKSEYALQLTEKQKVKFVYGILEKQFAIFMEAFLSFLGIGLQPPLASLGTMCNDASANLRTCPYQLFIPALVICLIMFAFNFVGDGLRDALDPKLKK